MDQIEPTEGPINDKYSSKPHYNTKYFVDGFRSLQSFSLKLEEGINVFVGTNGAGKTSFIALLDFLSIFLNSGLSAAVSDSGGIARVFSQESLKNRIPRVQIQISGLEPVSEGVRVTRQRHGRARLLTQGHR